MNKKNSLNDLVNMLPKLPSEFNNINNNVMWDETSNATSQLIPNIPINLVKSNNIGNRNDKTFEVQKCTVAIIDGDKIKNICLNDFGKSVITFGRSSDNDIVLSSPLVSKKHGYFNLSNNMVLIFDNQSKNGFYINNVKRENGISLKDGDAIKIDNLDKPLSKGVIMIVTMGEEQSEWQEYNLTDKEMVTIGRGEDCDIVLNRVSISLKHAKITKNKSMNGYSISTFDSKSGIILNNSILINPKTLKDKDVILIDNIKLIYNKNQILYQVHDYGIRLDAIDIVKTVKVKGKKKDIAQHIDFSASCGEFIAFVGGSGAGKSTFMKCISGVNKPTSGKVLINGSDLFSNYDVLKNLIGYVPQDDIVFNDLTLIDMLRYAANLRMPDDSTRQEKEERINAVLDIVELADKKNVMIRNLSGGQRKRASISVELIADPKLFFLDEPTSGLDPGAERNLMITLRKMADSGKTIILVTHNTLNLHLCDKVVFFGYGGKLCFDGSPNDALEFFGVDDFVDIYNLISSNADEWYNKFNESSYKKKPEINIEEESSTVIKKQSKSFFNQFLTLFSRKLKILINNKQQMLILFGQAPIISLLISSIVTDDLFYSYEETKIVMFSLALAGVWLGLSLSNQEVCSERVILKKEYMANLRLSAYLSSKIVYYFLIALIQSISIITVFILLVDVPQNGLIFSWYIEMLVIMFLTICSASSMGILVSVFAKNSSVASLVTVLLGIPQSIFSNMITELVGFSKEISNFILLRWSSEAFGTVNDLNSLITMVQEVIPGYVREPEEIFEFTVEHLTHDLTIIILMAVILFGVTYLVLKHQLEGEK